MALGKQLSEFDLELTAVTLGAGKKKSIKVSANFEGKVGGKLDGAVMATMEVMSPDGKDGTYKTYTRTLFTNGDIQDGIGSGQTTHTGDHKWFIAGTADTTDGRNYAVTGEIDYPARRFKGKIFNRSPDDE